MVNPTPSPAADPDLLNEQAILCEFLDTIDSDDQVQLIMISKYILRSKYIYSNSIFSRHPYSHGKPLFQYK